MGEPEIFPCGPSIGTTRLARTTGETVPDARSWAECRLGGPGHPLWLAMGTYLRQRRGTQTVMRRLHRRTRHGSARGVCVEADGEHCAAQPSRARHWPVPISTRWLPHVAYAMRQRPSSPDPADSFGPLARDHGYLGSRAPAALLIGQHGAPTASPGATGTGSCQGRSGGGLRWRW